MDAPPPYIGVPAATVVFYSDMPWYEDIEAVRADSPMLADQLSQAFPGRRVIDEFEGVRFLTSGPTDFSFRPEYRAAHADWIGMRWRRRVGPWYEVLTDARQGTYRWLHTADPRVRPITYVEGLLRFRGSRDVLPQGEGLAGHANHEDGWYHLPSAEDEEAWRSLRWTAFEPIRAAPSPNAAVVRPAVVIGYDCLIGREVRGEWVRVVSLPTGTCDSGEMKPRLEEPGGWVRWTDGRELLYGFNDEVMYPPPPETASPGQ